MSYNDDGPPPSEDEANGSDEDTAVEECKYVPSDTVPDEVESSAEISELSVVKPKQRPVKPSDSFEDFDPDDPPKPMTMLKVPKKYEKFTTKIRLQPPPRSKVTTPTSKKPKEAIEKSRKSTRGGDKESSKKSSKKSKATSGKSNSLKDPEPTTKSKKKSTRAEGKSVRKPAKTAIETIKQIISSMDDKASKLEQSTSTSPTGSSATPSVNTRSILPEPKARAKVKKMMKSYKAKVKAVTIKSKKDKSCVSSRVHGPVKEKQPEQKKTTAKSNPPVVAFTNDEMEDLNDEVSLHRCTHLLKHNTNRMLPFPVERSKHVNQYAASFLRQHHSFVG